MPQPDESQPDQPDELSPTELEVRRRLADARHTEPMPPEVAARLDGVLAGLAAEDAGAAPAPTTPATPTTPAPVDLDVHRRRRRVAQLLVAAAAVVVVGIGLGQVVDGVGVSSSDDSGEASMPAAREGVAADAERDAPQEGAPSAAAGSGDSRYGLPLPPAADLQPVRPQRFGADVRAVQKGYVLGQNGPVDAELDDLSADAAVRTLCRSRAWGSGTFVPVRYDGGPGVLVFRRAQGDTQVADLFVCGLPDPVRSITLPAP